MHNVTRLPSAGILGIGDEAVIMVHFSRSVRPSHANHSELQLHDKVSLAVRAYTLPTPSCLSAALGCRSYLTMFTIEVERKCTVHVSTTLTLLAAYPSAEEITISLFGD